MARDSMAPLPRLEREDYGDVLILLRYSPASV